VRSYLVRTSLTSVLLTIGFLQSFAHAEKPAAKPPDVLSERIGAGPRGSPRLKPKELRARLNREAEVFSCAHPSPSAEALGIMFTVGMAIRLWRQDGLANPSYGEHDLLGSSTTRVVLLSCLRRI
jgi:hypothetical protein